MKGMFLTAFLFAGAAIAQVSADATMGSGVIDSINKVNDSMPAAIPATILTIIVFLIEMCMRFFPTLKPRSLLIMVSSVLLSLSKLLLKLSGLADNIVQNLKPEAVVEKK